MIHHTINYVGWLGHRNLGDEAIYVSIKRLLRKYRFVRYDKILCSQVVVVGGGTLMPYDVTMYKPGKCNYVFGCGVKNPIFWGRNHGFFDSTVLRRLKGFNFRFIGVRGNISHNLLKEWDIDSEVIGDPVLSLSPDPRIERDCKNVAINIGSDGLLWGRDEGRVSNEIAKTCALLKQAGYHPVLIPFSQSDISNINNVAEAENIPVFREWSNIQKTLDFIASCKILIGEKLHSVVFSASTYTPFICLEYRPKCFDFSESVGFSDYVIRTDSVSSARVMTMFNSLVNNWQRMQGELMAKVNMYRGKQADFAARIINDIESLPEDKWRSPRFSETLAQRIFWNTDALIHRKAYNAWRAYNRIIQKLQSKH